MKVLITVIVLAFFPIPAAFCDDGGELPEAITYTNARGVHLTGPAGWIMYRGMRRHPEILAVFSRLPYDSQEPDNPKIVLIAEKRVKKGPDSAMAKTRRDAELLELMRNRKEIGAAMLLEPPRAEDGSSFSLLSYEITRRVKNGSETLRSCEYIFLKDDNFYTLLCGTRPEYFEKYRRDFDRTAQSLGFTPR
jgi:hypothetical protein